MVARDPYPRFCSLAQVSLHAASCNISLLGPHNERLGQCNTTKVERRFICKLSLSRERFYSLTFGQIGQQHGTSS
jgi:hypothetical protein